MKSTFEYDLKFGEIYENEFMQWAESNDLTIKKMPGKFSEYDFIVSDPDTDESLTVELKTDRQALRTGNIALELYKWVDGAFKSSGLSASTSDTFVFKLIGVDGFYSIPTNKLREIVKDKTNYKTIYSGDNQSVYTALFKRDFLLQHCKHLT